MELFTDTLCASCYEGSEQPLHYFCSKCNQKQRIPHPMYKYQQTPDVHGTASWACHQKCGDYTFWRIDPADIPKLAPGKIPKTWPSAI
jgi:hypothetical protein